MDWTCRQVWVVREASQASFGPGKFFSRPSVAAATGSCCIISMGEYVSMLFGLFDTVVMAWMAPAVFLVWGVLYNMCARFYIICLVGLYFCSLINLLVVVRNCVCNLIPFGLLMC